MQILGPESGTTIILPSDGLRSHYTHMSRFEPVLSLGYTHMSRFEPTDRNSPGQKTHEAKKHPQKFSYGP